MSLTRYEFELLRLLEREGDGSYPIRQLSDRICISGRAVEDGLSGLCAKAYIDRAGDALTLTEAGREALEPYRVKRAVVVAAGFGSRMMPATADRPKPMVTVNGVRLIDTLLDALLSAGVEEITVVGGYQIEKLYELLEKYPFLRIVHNEKYARENNISSALAAADFFYGGCYFCEADLYITNPGLLQKYQYATNILGSWSVETDDWCFDMAEGCLTNYRKGGTYCYNYYGISYWTDEDSARLKRDWAELYAAPGGKELFWEFPPFIYRKENYRVEIRPCRKQDIIEIDSYAELARLDASYQE